MKNPPEIKELVVYVHPPDEGRWLLPSLGTVLRVLNIRKRRRNKNFPIQVEVETYQPNSRNRYHNSLKPEHLEYLWDVQNKMLSQPKKNTTNCCWTCEFFSTPDTCEMRRCKFGVPERRTCMKPYGDGIGNDGCFHCYGTVVSGTGCTDAVPCWKKYPFYSGGLRKNRANGIYQANLIFPKCPD